MKIIVNLILMKIFIRINHFLRFFLSMPLDVILLNYGESNFVIESSYKR